IMRNRLEHGRDSKAQRGELFYSVPMGYVILPTGEVNFDPDEQAREVVRLVFDKFEELGTIYGLFYWLLQHDIQMPIRDRGGSKQHQTGSASRGVPRSGAAQLAGLVVCGNRGRHMQPACHASGKAQYACARQYVEGTGPRCYGLLAQPIDTLVGRQVLAALEPG